MRIEANNRIIESDDPALAVAAAIATFGDEPDVEAVRAWALGALNIWRGEQRRGLGLTDAWGQELVYSGKFTQAQWWNEDNERTFYFPLEAAARGLTDQAMVDLILAQGEAWLYASDAIEAAYWIAKEAVEAAGDVAAIAAVLAGLAF